MQCVSDAMLVGQVYGLLDDVDVEDVALVEDVFPRDADKAVVVGAGLGNGRFYFGEAERYHEVCARAVIYDGVVVVGLQVHNFLQVNYVQFSLNAEY